MNIGNIILFGVGVAAGYYLICNVKLNGRIL